MGAAYGSPLFRDSDGSLSGSEQGAGGRGRKYADGIFPVRRERDAGRDGQLKKLFP